MGSASVSQPRVDVGTLPVDGVTTFEALARVDDLVASGLGGAIFTPNVDHVVQAEHNPRMRAAYSRADLSLADGMPVLWAARLLGTPLPEKISGSDFTPLLVERAALRGWRVYLLGGAPGVAASARDHFLTSYPGLAIVGTESPAIDVDDADAVSAVVERVRAARPQVVLVALGAPKQEIWIDLARERLRPAVLMGIGASLDFVAGTIPRAPRWMSNAGLEWLYRLQLEPGRLWKRYLLRDPEFALIVARALRDRKRPR